MTVTTQNRLASLTEGPYSVYFQPGQKNLEDAAHRALDFLKEHGLERVPFSLGGYTCLRQDDGRLVILPDLN